jgi:hypothetical protein
MHYVAHRSHWMQKHMFGVTCPGVVFMETAPGPPSLKIVRPDFALQMHRNALRDPHIPPDKNLKFNVTCLGALFVEFVLVPTEYEE